jgi:hypothetical protein
MPVTFAEAFDQAMAELRERLLRCCVTFSPAKRTRR